MPLPPAPTKRAALLSPDAYRLAAPQEEAPNSADTETLPSATRKRATSKNKAGSVAGPAITGTATVTPEVVAAPAKPAITGPAAATQTPVTAAPLSAR